MIESRLQKLGLSLPSSPAVIANYLPFVKTGSLVFISGQLPYRKGQLEYRGKLGREFSIEEGQKAAQLCALNILTQLKEACGGNWEKILCCIRIGGFVHSADDFVHQSQVINGASDLLVDVFGEKGRHTRVAVGVNALPLGAAVEIEALFEVKE